MRYKTVDSFDFAGKRVLVRIDINSEIKKGKPVDNPRIVESSKTIKELISKNAKVVVIAHQGRPGKDDFISLSGHAKLLSKYVKIKFVNDIIGPKAIDSIMKLKEGEAVLLENTRFLNDELNPSKDNVFVNTLSPLFDYYVNDAFSVSHRVQSSITEFPKKLKSCVGRLMESELKNVEKLKLKDCLFVLGGAKPDDVILLLKNKNIIATGVLANLALIARGFSLGKEDSLKEKYPEALKEIKKNINHITTPFDFAIDEEKRKEITLASLPVNSNILDIGPGSTNSFVHKITTAKTIFMKGTAGMCEKEGFEKGTKELMKAMERTHAFTVISGGNSTTALENFGIDKSKINYISLSGGALVHYLAGKKLPGLDVLR